MADQTFVSGQILTAAQMTSLQGDIGLTQITPTAVTNATLSGGVATIGSLVSSVTITGVFTSTFDSYRIVVSGGAGSVATENLNMTLGSTATGYYWARTGRTFADTDNGGASGGSVAFWRAGGTNTAGINMIADVLNPFLADESVFYSSSIYLATGGGSFNAAGFLNNSTSYTSFTLAPGSGTISGGTIVVYGYRKS